ncbi:torsin-1A-like isoform X1 [Echeneis naucrates]|uniref:Torsin n=1 Tax=Echeneis naucrates TaxID=173247 RepID=A0A665W668_ECHNA|nr:torsin-1A-like isoform X1 [Echeneis naucrates]
MRLMKPDLLPMWLLLCSGLTEAFEPASSFLVGAAGVAAAGWISPKIFCYFQECCQPDWISFSSRGLKTDLDKNLFGQHIASRIIQTAVSGFMNSDRPKKPLVLSLHGWTGTGKNFVSQLIAENIYKEGMDSNFVHVFSTTTHFPHQQTQLNSYKSQLQRWIKGNVTNCERSFFIFDEVDKMNPDLIESIKPFLDYYDKVDGVSYLKSIFIFLSNTGGDNIAQIALDYWKAGKNREEIKYTDLEGPLSEALFNSKGGFFRSGLIENSLVDFFVPFLPLEYKHVVQCALRAMRDNGYLEKQDMAERLAGDFIYFPKTEKVFSASGCKKVQTKLPFYM